MPRNLPPRIQSHIARAQRRRFIAASFTGLCLLVGAGAALAQTQLPSQIAATLKPIASNVGASLSQLPSALSEITPQLPRTQLAASATSFPNYIAEKVRNLFCRWLGCAAPDLRRNRSRRLLHRLGILAADHQQRFVTPRLC